MNMETPRPYRQTTRAAKAADTALRIVESFRSLVLERWLDEITLDEVAAMAGVTAQTVIRRFGGKQGLIDATAEAIRDSVLATRSIVPGDIVRSLASLLADYEANGDTVIRLLAQESRQPALAPMLEAGRKHHRRWVEDLFVPLLPRDVPLNRQIHEETLAALVCATDVYTWNLLRRDQKHSQSETLNIMQHMAEGALARCKHRLEGETAK